MNKTRGKQSMTNLAALLLLGVFSACILLVLIQGAGIYRRLTERNGAAFDQRTCLQYLATKVRQASDPAAVSVSDFGDGDCLVITEEIDGELFWTRVYCYDGWMMELFTIAEESFEPVDGEKILKIQELELIREGNLLRIRMRIPSGEQETLTLSLRGEGLGL